MTGAADDSIDDVNADGRPDRDRDEALGAPAMKIRRAALGSSPQATEIADARNAFGELSEALVAYIDRPQAASRRDGVKVAFCPMVRQAVAAEGRPIANPYYGSEMLTCGSFR